MVQFKKDKEGNFFVVREEVKPVVVEKKPEPVKKKPFKKVK